MKSGLQSAAELWAKNDFWNGGRSAIFMNFLEMFIFGYLAVIRFQICSWVPGFIKIEWFFMEIPGLFDMSLKNLGFLGFFKKPKKPKKSEFRFFRFLENKNLMSEVFKFFSLIMQLI